MAVTTAAAVARFFVDAARGRGEDPDRLKIQKLLYYAQGEHLGRHGTPLFDEPIQAWRHGPVQPDVYRLMKTCDLLERVDLPDDRRAFLTEIDNTYGHLSPGTLREMMHGEQPWVKTRGPLSPEDNSESVIPQDLMRSFFEGPQAERENYVRERRAISKIIDRDIDVLRALADA